MRYKPDFFSRILFLKGCKIQFYFIFVVILNEVLSMRIDQYLWCIRVYKSRNIASNACKKGQVLINDQKVKPSREILPLDLIQVRKDQLWRSFEVLDLPKSRVGAKLVGLYCVEKTEKHLIEKEVLKKLSAQVAREQGTGRPTKKDRRDLDEIQLDENLTD
jgi:ribosome-associated heat shock protein Hsp15